jgi:hypothetical protein
MLLNFTNLLEPIIEYVYFILDIPFDGSCSFVDLRHGLLNNLCKHVNPFLILFLELFLHLLLPSTNLFFFFPHLFFPILQFLRLPLIRFPFVLNFLF